MKHILFSILAALVCAAPSPAAAQSPALRALGGIDFPNAMGIGLRHEGREYAFRPGSGDIIKLDIDYGNWQVRARNRKGELLIADLETEEGGIEFGSEEPRDFHALFAGPHKPQ